MFEWNQPHCSWIIWAINRGAVHHILSEWNTKMWVSGQGEKEKVQVTSWQWQIEKNLAYFYFVRYGIDKHPHKHYTLMLCKAMFGWWELKRIWTPSFAPFLPSFLAQTKIVNSVESVENIGIWILTKSRCYRLRKMSDGILNCTNPFFSNKTMSSTGQLYTFCLLT